MLGSIMRQILKMGQLQLYDNDEYNKYHRVSSGAKFHRWSHAHLCWPTQHYKPGGNKAGYNNKGAQ